MLANDSDSDDESDGPSPPLVDSSDGEDAVNFDADDSEDEVSDDEEGYLHCCPYECMTRGVPCRRRLMDSMLKELGMWEDGEESEDEEPLVEAEEQISKINMLSMKPEKEEKVDTMAPLLQPYAAKRDEEIKETQLGVNLW